MHIIKCGDPNTITACSSRTDSIFKDMSFTCISEMLCACIAHSLLLVLLIVVGIIEMTAPVVIMLGIFVVRPILVEEAFSPSMLAFSIGVLMTNFTFT